MQVQEVDVRDWAILANAIGYGLAGDWFRCFLYLNEAMGRHVPWRRTIGNEKVMMS